jgi:cbb3-type cytochrome oxidase subunit 3
MQTDERIIKYIEDELTADERISFECDLKTSILLRDEYQQYLNLRKNIDLSKEAKLSQDYLDSIVPEFRNKFHKSKSGVLRRNFGYAFGTMLIFIFSVVILKSVFTDNSEMNTIQEFAESLNEAEKIELLENMNGDLDEYDLFADNYSGTEISDLLSQELEISYNVVDAYDISYTDLVEELNPEEAEKIYNEILNKRIF